MNMGYFSMQDFYCVLWIAVSAVILCASSQELTSTLPEGNLACPGDEIIFTCVIKGSSTMSSLILSWSSSEYIGPIDIAQLQFTTDNMPGTTMMSMVNRNVTATLTNITAVSGVSVMESKLRVIAKMNSSAPGGTVTCHSSSNGSATSINFYFPAQLIYAVAATEILSVPGPCTLLFALQLPFNISARDVDHYIIRIPSVNITTNKTSTLFHLLIPLCSSSKYDIYVQSVDRCGRVGSKTIIIPHLLTSDVLATVKPPYYDGVQPTHKGISYSAHVLSGLAIFSSIIACSVAISVAIVLYFSLRKRRASSVRYSYHGEETIRDPLEDATAVAIPQKDQEKYHDIDTSRPPREQLGSLPSLPSSVMKNLGLTVGGATCTANLQLEGRSRNVLGARKSSQVLRDTTDC